MKVGVNKQQPSSKPHVGSIVHNIIGFNIFVLMILISKQSFLIHSESFYSCISNGYIT